MIKLESLLKQVSEIVAIEKTQQEEKRKRGENFNIFNVLGVSTSEVRLHSAFLAELLNPNGDHGLGYKFLEAFLSIIIQRVKPGFEFDIKSAKVSKEFYIGPISADYTEGGQIDLLIQDKDNHTIVIENKIGANDQEKQLLRYDNYAKKNTTASYMLLYLTLNGDEATEYSTCNQVEYQRISYRKDIHSWLQKCISIAALHPIVRETIVQYITNIEQITNIMSEDNKDELIELLKNNISAAVSVLRVEEEIKREVRRNFIETVLKRIAKKNGFNINREHLAENYDLLFEYVFESEEEHKGAFVLSMYKSNQKLNNAVFYGIKLFDEQYYGIKGEKVWGDHNNNKFPYGLGWIKEPKCYWDRVSTIINMQEEIEMDEAENKEGTIAKEIDDALKVVKEKNLLGQLDKLCEDKS